MQGRHSPAPSVLAGAAAMGSPQRRRRKIKKETCSLTLDARFGRRHGRVVWHAVAGQRSRHEHYTAASPLSAGPWLAAAATAVAASSAAAAAGPLSQGMGTGALRLMGRMAEAEGRRLRHHHLPGVTVIGGQQRWGLW
jgi:hypothetical protein